MTDEAILRALQSNDRTGLQSVYTKYREPCLRFLLARIIPLQTPNRQDLAVELFTESLIVLVDNARSGRLTKLSARLDTYLNAVARNLHRKQVRKGQREQYHAPAELPRPLVEEEEPTDGEEVLKVLRHRLTKLGGRCQELITHYYFLGLDWKTIAGILEYKNAASAKSNKAKCMARLRSLYGITPTAKVKKHEPR